uniref:Uncharacterized protein n=1 Tax=Sphaerodactylus townsendi TaxID=933632 RepID=A0ACB8FYP4_9SAUR
MLRNKSDHENLVTWIPQRLFRAAPEAQPDSGFPTRVAELCGLGGGGRRDYSGAPSLGIAAQTSPRHPQGRARACEVVCSGYPRRVRAGPARLLCQADLVCLVVPGLQQNTSAEKRQLSQQQQPARRPFFPDLQILNSLLQRKLWGGCIKSRA